MHLPGSVILEDSIEQWSQYEFILYVKQRYQVFRMLPRELPAEGWITTSTKIEAAPRGGEGQSASSSNGYKMNHLNTSPTMQMPTAIVRAFARRGMSS